VGFNGYPHGSSNFIEVLHTGNEPNTLGLILDTQLEAQSPLLLRGVEWIYSWTESAIAYSSAILYESNLIPTDIADIEHLLWSSDYKLSTFIFMCILQDLQFISASILFPYIDNWYNYIHLVSNNIIFYLEHPEHHLIYNNALIDYIVTHISKIHFLIELESSNEGVILIPFIILDLIWKITLLGIFVSFLLNWYNVSANNNNIDSDFLVNSLSIESEEEIASIDDTVLLLIVIFFYFWMIFLF
jgi:hypothetical protein